MAVDVDALADVVVLTIKGALAPVLERLAVLETKMAAAPLEQAFGELKAHVAHIGTQAARVSELDGLCDRVAAAESKDLTLFVRELIDGPIDALVKRVAAIESIEMPLPNVEALVKSAVADAVTGIQPRDGKDGMDGTSVTVEDVRPLIASEVEKQVSTLPSAQDGKDGLGVMGVLIDRDGHLVATLSDGTVKQCGMVVGRDGRDADMAVLEQRIVDEVGKIPRPNDGAPGAPGRDGTLERIKFVQSDDFRTVTACFKDGTPIEGGVLSFPVVLDRGVFKAGTAYQVGDSVTWAGSTWIAQRDTSDKPGEGATAWRLAVKRGADGKIGQKGDPGFNGKDGAPGRDGTKAW